MTQLKTSSIPLVKAALVDLFTTTLKSMGRDGGQLQVLYGFAPNLEGESVQVSDTIAPEQQKWAQLGAKNREEQYELHIYILVRVPGDTQRQATERAFVILALLETALRVDVHVGLAGSYQSIEIQFAQAQLSEAQDPDGEGYQAEIPWAVRVTTRM